MKEIRSSVSDRIVARLARPTRGLVAEIDGLRFIAISAVILFHIWTRIAFWVPGSADNMGWLERILDQGYFGVMLFFVLSGFILSLPFAEYALTDGRKVDIGFYFIRRLVRIEPPYIINIVIATILTVVFLRHPASEVMPHFLASLVYLHNQIFQAHYPGSEAGLFINGVTWTLEIEVQFYILAPLMCAVYFVRNTTLRRGLILGAMVAAALSSQLLLSAHPAAMLSIAGYVAYFLAGFFLSDMYLLNWKARPRRSGVADLVGVLAVAGLMTCLLVGPSPHRAAASAGPLLHWSVLAPFLVLVFYACVFCGRWLNRLLTNRWVVVSGGMCYSFYLYHSLVTGAIFSKSTLRFYSPRWPFAASFALQCALILPVVAVVCVFFFLVCEQPFMRRELQVRVLAALSRPRAGRPEVDCAPTGLQHELKCPASPSLES